MIGRQTITDEWRSQRVHWHAYVIPRTDSADRRWRLRVVRLDSEPDAVLSSPVAVADWIERLTREHIEPRQTWAAAEQSWVEFGDADDLARSRRLHLVVASHGDSLYVDIPTSSVPLDLFVEAVTHAECDQHNPEGDPAAA
ncbi:hypothetical protein CFN78_18900 [Amycolatopsis antarctica]|uniref:Uncharacterized protein n=1 Tax=Amycolatopsis antarctica TaxID=1854586 RepID=A0A263D280_9PSEU|nr:hypothetical protein [Amycolatopsis antarctica]OZM71596.1 hypothetical protein CFN78_18900 [Amycolatopsis antarctica]